MAVMVGSTTPSSKALGKRPVKPYADGIDFPMDTNDIVSRDVSLLPDEQITHLETQTRQKRVLPSRSTRGGPGVGTCEIDLSILDALKRRGESDPLIPSTSKFVLTTDSSLIPSTSSKPSSLASNPYATERYFDRPEVIEAYRFQQEIQTPEFCVLSDEASVGGRLRARGEEESADTSDAAYERRHRKYETFEKRQRLREKEKLQHEHYKLKGRIEQLRVMDPMSFLTLSASYFPSDPDVDSIHLLDGPAAISEGEMRKSAMIEVACGLEERYKMLLARKDSEKQRTSAQPSTEPEAQAPPEEEEEEEEMEPDDSDAEKVNGEVTSSRGRKLKLKIKITPHLALPKIQTLSKNDKIRHRSTLLSAPSTPPAPKARRDALEVHTPQSTPGLSLQPASTPAPNFTPRLSRSPSISDMKDFTMVDTHATENVAVAVAPSPPHIKGPAPVGRPRKKFRLIKLRHSLPSTLSENNSMPQTKMMNEPAESPFQSVPSPAATHEGGEYTMAKRKQQPVILLAASRNADTPDARKTARHVLAFGARVPREIETLKDFALPFWLLEDDDQQESDADPDFPPFSRTSSPEF